MEIQTRVRKWGNSFGLVIPAEEVREKNLQENEEIIITIEKKRSIKELFGSLKNWKINSNKVKKELKKEWSKW